jgi:hypothetical protein
LSSNRIPTDGELGVLNWLNARALEFAEHFGGGVVGETQVKVGERFVENWGAEKAGHLLFFDGVAGGGNDMAAAGEDSAGYLTFVWREEGEFPGFEREVAIAPAEFDAIGGSDFVDSSRIDAEGIECFVGVSRRFFGGKRRKGHQAQAEREEGHPWPHAESVVTFGIGEQGVPRDR